MRKTWTLAGPDGKPYASVVPGALGGHRRSRIYGRLDCPAALRATLRGIYQQAREDPSRLRDRDESALSASR